MRKIRAYSVVVFCVFMPITAQAAVDIARDVYCFYTTSPWLWSDCHSWKYTPKPNDDATNTFYATNTDTYSGTGNSFTANYKNGTLILGNNTKQTGSGSLSFGSGGGGGYVGYMSGTFNVKEAYLTGTIKGGNNTKVGAGLTLNINATSDINTDGLNVSMWSNTQGDQFSLKSTGGDVKLKNTNIRIQGADFASRSGSFFFVEAKKGKIDADKLNVTMPETTGFIKVKFEAQDLVFKNSNLTIDNSSTAGINSETQFISSNNISVDNTNNFNLHTEVINFTAGKNLELSGKTNISISTLTAKPQMTFKAGEKLDINTMNMNVNLQALHTGGFTNINFEGKNMTIKDSELRVSSPGIGNLSADRHNMNFTTTSGDMNFTNTKIIADGGRSTFELSATNGKIIGDNLTYTMGGGEFSNSSAWSANSIDLKNSTINIAEASLAGQSSSATFNATSGDINFDKSTNATISTERVEFKATNDIKLLGTNTIKSGGNTTNADIDFDAGGNIHLGATNIQVFQGNGALNMKAGRDITIDKLDLHGKMWDGTIVVSLNPSYATFEAQNITINGGRIYSTRGINNSTDTAGEFITTFHANGDINLKNVNITLANQLANVGSPDMIIFKGENLTHTGIFDTQTAQQTWEGATFDFSGVRKSASVGTMIVEAAKIKLNNNFKADSLTIRTRETNGGSHNGTPGVGTVFFTKTDSNLKFGTITLNGWGQNGNQVVGNTARLSFFNESGTNNFVKNSTLTVDTVKLGSESGFYASNIETSNIQNLILDHNARAEFYKLNIINNGSIEMNATSSIGLSYFDVKVNQSNNSVNNYGRPILYITHAGKNLSNLTIEGNKTYRFIDAMEIKYIFTTASGNTQTFHCGDSGTQAQCDYIKNSIAIYEGAKVEPTINADGSIDYTQDRVDLAKLQAKLQAGLNNIGLRYEKVVDYSTIGIKILGNNPDNPYDINDIRYYIWQKGGKSRGDEYVAKIAAISPTTARQETITQTQNGQVVYTKYDEQKKEQVVCRDNTAGCSAHQVETSNSDIFKWLQFVSIHSRGITFTGTNIMDYDIGFFEHTATQLYNTLEQLSSTERKSSTAEATKLAADIAKIQRLVKLSRVDSYDNGIKFASLMQNKKRAHYANNSSTRSDIEDVTLDPAYLYKFSNRHTYANNIWANAIGSASFISNGYGALYGLNVGYDRFLNLGENGLILGVFAAYGYGTYTADLIKNNSHNVNSGIYSRAIIKNHEFDFNAGYTIGMNNEDINARENIWLSQLGQSYKYNTHTFNLNANYGYIFGMKGKTLVFKPSIGMSYYMINVGKINGADSLITAFDPNTTNQSFTNYTNNLGIQSPQALQHVLALNVAFETRQYFQKGSYWFINVGAQRDIYISSNNIAEVRFVGSNNLSYKQGDNLNTFANATAGGEVQFLEQFFINFGLGGKVGLSYKDINITGNLGARYVF
ncbi:hypothetical glycine-rich autotransporter [Helicobacter fennelliae]|uniref:Hypothetical glycine-rich autotransporter n=1 Tax=Helicobacter fennelliae TaxID=215 RepID=A0A2X3BAZ2_9HELI|nr:vacuolating cytotoxin domain-containing protein [Helicobacter fennelliae]SQB98041.1 hypothetical glycine-rich autotransporter [Helicobacter fennelliae]